MYYDALRCDASINDILACLPAYRSQRTDARCSHYAPAVRPAHHCNPGCGSIVSLLRSTAPTASTASTAVYCNLLRLLRSTANTCQCSPMVLDSQEASKIRAQQVHACEKSEADCDGGWASDQWIDQRSKLRDTIQTPYLKATTAPDICAHSQTQRLC